MSRRSQVALLTTFLLLVGCTSGPGPTTSPESTTSGQGGETPITSATSEATDDVAVFLEELAATGGEPIDLVPTLAEGAVTAEIGREGGSVTATGPDGTTYLLELPADALLFPTDITLTPLADVTGFPFDAPPEHRVGVDLAPRGLELGRQATLTITPAVSPEGMAVAALGYLGGGADAGSELFSAEAGSIILTLEHFSGYVVIYPVELPHWRAIARAELENAVRAFEHELATLLALHRERAIRGLSVPDPVTIARDFLSDYKRLVLVPYLNSAALGCQEGTDAIAAWFAYWRQVQQLGVAGDADSLGDPDFFVEFGGEVLTSSFEIPERLLPTMVDHCFEEDYRACVITGDLGILFRRIHTIERTVQLLGRTIEPTWVDLLIDYARKCGQWQLTVHTEFRENPPPPPPGTDGCCIGTGAVTRHIDLRWEPGGGVLLERVANATIEGQAEVEPGSILFRWAGGSCSVTNTPPTPDTLARARIVKLAYDYDEPAAGSTAIQGRPTNLTVAIQLGRAATTYSSHCYGVTTPSVPSWFDEHQVGVVMFESGAVRLDPEAGSQFPMLIEEGWDYVGAPFRARFFKEATSPTFFDSYAQLDVLLTHTPQ